MVRSISTTLLLCLLTVLRTTAQSKMADWTRHLDGVVNDPDVTGWTAQQIAGGQMHLRRSGQLLEVAIRTSPLMVASLCLATNDQVRVLHASAALGSVTYSKIGEAYETNQSFEWRMRETALDSVTRSQRSEHFERERWVANTLRMGTPGQVEFRIQLDSDQTETRIALGLMKLESLGRVTAWPERAAGACADAQLVSGSAPRIVAFRPNEWPVIPGAAPR